MQPRCYCQLHYCSLSLLSWVVTPVWVVTVISWSALVVITKVFGWRESTITKPYKCVNTSSSNRWCFSYNFASTRKSPPWAELFPSGIVALSFWRTILRTSLRNVAKNQFRIVIRVTISPFIDDTSDSRPVTLFVVSSEDALGQSDTFHKNGINLDFTFPGVTNGSRHLKVSFLTRVCWTKRWVAVSQTWDSQAAKLVLD